MAGTKPQPNVVNFEEIRLMGERTVNVTIRGAVLTVTEKLEDDSSVERELGRARMRARDGAKAARALMALPSEETSERKDAESAILRVTSSMDDLDAIVTFDRRRIICQRITGRFSAWNVVGADSKPLRLDFDGLYDGPLSTETLETIYQAVRDEPIVGEASA